MGTGSVHLLEQASLDVHWLEEWDVSSKEVDEEQLSSGLPNDIVSRMAGVDRQAAEEYLKAFANSVNKGRLRPELLERLASLLRTKSSADGEAAAGGASREGDGASLLIGALGFLACSGLSEQWKQSTPGSDTHRALGKRLDDLLAAPELRSLLCSYYGVTGDGFVPEGKLHFYRAGTTSLILKTKLASGNTAALKVLKLQYADDPRIRTQTHQDDGTEVIETLEGLIPKLINKGDCFVLMELVPGLTLREYCAEVDRMPDQEKAERTRVGLLRVVIGSVASTLKKAAEHNVYHHDISPDNIILRGTEHAYQNEHADIREIQSVVLIDWGFNYLMLEGIGSSKALDQLRSFVAPELRRQGQAGLAELGVRADLYSLGAIMLDILSDESLLPECQSRLLDQLWARYPGLAEIVEELIDGHPQNRMLTRSSRVEAAVYSQLRSDVDVQVSLLTSKDQYFNVLDARGLSQTLVTAITSSTPLAFLTILADKSSLDEECSTAGQEELRRLRYLRKWLVVAHCCNSLVLGSLMYVFTRDMLQSGFAGAHIGSRLICLTFSLIATAYYTNIYGRQYARDTHPLAELSMRFNAWCFMPPIMIAIWARPDLWPYCSAAGVFFVSINNAITYRAAQADLTRTKAVLGLEKSGALDSFFELYPRWSILTFVYAALLCLVGALTASRVLHDVWFYVTLSLLVNLMMLIWNCNRNAPMVRAGLNRMFARGRRITTRETVDLRPAFQGAE